MFQYSRVSNRRGGWNKKGSWQISTKIINGKGAINEELGKNLQGYKRGGWNIREVGKLEIRKFIEIKSSNDLVEISTKRT